MKPLTPQQALADARAVLAEVAALVTGGDQPGVPFFDNSGSTPQFRRIL